jgi:outer membrane protein
LPLSNPRTRLLAVIFPLVLLAGVSFAQQPAAPPSTSLRLTLKEAVQLGLKQNPSAVIARLLAMESIQNRNVALSPLLPQADIAADGAVKQYNLLSVERLPKRQAAGPFQVIEAGPEFSQSLLSLPLLRGYQIGREGVREARANEEASREDVVASVVAQYLLVLRALATYEAAQSRVALAQRLYEQAAQLQKTGIGLNIDTVRANVELQNERQNLIDSETQTHTTKYVLAELLDLPRDQEIDTVDHLDFFDLPSFDRDSLMARALTARPEIRSIESQQRIASLTTKSIGEERWPELDFSGFWLYQGDRFNTGIPAYNYTLSLEFPIFTGGRIRAEEAHARLEQQHVDESRRQLEAQIVREVKSAIDELNAARHAVDVANLGYQLANEEVAQAQRRFAAGVTTNVEVITAQDELARASDNQIEALYRFNQSRADLAHSLGEIENTYAK